MSLSERTADQVWRDLQENKIAADPLLAKNNVRARTANEMLRAFAHVREYGHLLWLPIYCHHGTSDKLASISVCFWLFLQGHPEHFT